MTNAFHLTPLEVLRSFDELSLPKNFCVVPFTNLILNPSGKVSVCRQKGTDHTIGDLNNQSLEEIWNGDTLKQWRKEFLDGNPQICKKEIENDQCHLGSGSYFFFKDVQLDITQKNLPLKLTANFNGSCNLKCEMCHVWTMENGFYDKIDYWPELREKFLPYIKEIELLSGEPFVQQDTFRLIEEVSAVNPDCVWSFTTNGHWTLTEKVQKALSKITVKNIIYSVDSLDSDRYHQIRKPGNLKVVLDNIEAMKIYNFSRGQEIALNFHFLVMQSNWDELYDVLQFCREKQLMPILNYLNEPVEFSLSTLSEEKRRGIMDFYLSEKGTPYLREGMRIILSLNHSFDSKTKLDNLIRIQERLDAIEA